MSGGPSVSVRFYLPVYYLLSVVPKIIPCSSISTACGVNEGTDDAHSACCDRCPVGTEQDIS
jgi:hypothetical protein